MKKVLYTVLILALASVAFAADHPDFTGNWKIDASKAAEGKGPSPQTTRKITEEGNVITMTEVQPGRDGNEVTIVRKFSTDASEVTGEMRGQPMKSHGAWEGDKLVSDTTIGDKTMIHDVWSLSDDGKTWTNEMTFGGRPPLKVVFLKQ
jgi:hypothetical protein